MVEVASDLVGVTVRKLDGKEDFIDFHVGVTMVAAVAAAMLARAMLARAIVVAGTFVVAVPLPVTMPLVSILRTVCAGRFGYTEPAVRQ